MIQPIRIKATIRRSADEDTVILDLGSEVIKDWTLAFCMLSRSLIANVVAISAALNLSVAVDSRLEPRDRARFRWESSKKLSVDLSPNELDVWERFFLKYCRDEIAAVDHLDLEMAASSDTSKPASLVLRVPNAVPPVDAQEARRRLGLGRPGLQPD